MANAMPQALGAKAAFPDRQVIALSGDGGLAMMLGDLLTAVQAWLAEPGPALLDVVTDRFELVMPPQVKPGEVAGMALYSAKAVLGGRGRDVVGIIRNLIS